MEKGFGRFKRMYMDEGDSGSSTDMDGQVDEVLPIPSNKWRCKFSGMCLLVGFLLTISLIQVFLMGYIAVHIADIKREVVGTIEPMELKVEEVTSRANIILMGINQTTNQLMLDVREEMDITRSFDAFVNRTDRNFKDLKVLCY